jgi:hypothetical protein
MHDKGSSLNALFIEAAVLQGATTPATVTAAILMQEQTGSCLVQT